ncbi:hypothetical protein FRC01_013732 [Tulasnella sp. 417]|nr:hypothetical protein FRC01_013732 [Tulasnella sp. 417]
MDHQGQYVKLDSWSPPPGRMDMKATPEYQQTFSSSTQHSALTSAFSGQTVPLQSMIINQLYHVTIFDHAAKQGADLA